MRTTATMLEEGAAVGDHVRDCDGDDQIVRSRSHIGRDEKHIEEVCTQ